MKRFIVVLSSLLMLPAFAEVAPVYYDDFTEYSDDFIEEADPEETARNTGADAQHKSVTQRSTANRSTSRAIYNTKGTSSGTRVTASSSRNNSKSARTVASRSAKPVTRDMTTKSSTGRARVVSRSGRATQPVTARISTTGSVMGKVTNSGNSYYQTTLNDSSTSLYNPTRVATPSNRRATFRAASTTTTGSTVTDADISNTTSSLEALTELTEYCKTQYAACMDNYCNVLDDNQGRCSCSKNIKNYANVEAALEKATEEFQDTVQKIKYIGLTADQINSLFAETDAESAMKSTKDTSSLKSTLDKIKDKILVDATSPSAKSNYTSGINMDLSGLLDIDLSSGFDLGSFLNMESNTGASNVSNQRGEQLFKTATTRCKTAVLNSCTAQGIDPNIVTNSYDLEIDKQCIAYERSLNEANTEMRTNVRNAATILQQARLMLTQNKNAYDLRGCVAALDACMQDEYVCGSDYALCLDPTGKYLADGSVIKGSTPGVSGGSVKNTAPICNAGSDSIPTGCQPVDTWMSGGMYELYETWNYTVDNKENSAWGGGAGEKLGAYIDDKLSTWEKDYESTSVASDDMATYLLQKIGYIDNKDKVHGMCASAMKQCQDYTFDSKSKYKPNNEVVRQYLASTLSKIKLQQDAILADYAEDCLSDVSSCLSTNGFDESSVDGPSSRAALNACRADIVTCMSVNGQKPNDANTLTLRAMKDWVASMLMVCGTDQYIYENSSTNTVTCAGCPSVTKDGLEGTAIQLRSNGGREAVCHCPDGYVDGGMDSTGMPTNCISESN